MYPKPVSIYLRGTFGFWRLGFRGSGPRVFMISGAKLSSKYRTLTYKAYMGSLGVYKGYVRLDL